MATAWKSLEQTRSIGLTRQRRRGGPLSAMDEKIHPAAGKTARAWQGKQIDGYNDATPSDYRAAIRNDRWCIHFHGHFVLWTFPWIFSRKPSERCDFKSNFIFQSMDYRVISLKQLTYCHLKTVYQIPHYRLPDLC